MHMFAGSVPSPAQCTEWELFSNCFDWLSFLGLNPPIKAHSELPFYCRIIPKSLQTKSFSYPGGRFLHFVQWLVLSSIEIPAGLFSLAHSEVFKMFLCRDNIPAVIFAFLFWDESSIKDINVSLVSFMRNHSEFTGGIQLSWQPNSHVAAWGQMH